MAKRNILVTAMYFLLLSLTVILNFSTGSSYEDSSFWKEDTSLYKKMAVVHDYFYKVDQLEDRIVEIRKQQPRLILIEMHLKIYDIYEELEYLSMGMHQANCDKYNALKQEQFNIIMEIIKN